MMKYQFTLLLCSVFLGFSLIDAEAETQVLDYIKIVVNNEILTNNEVQEAVAGMRAQILQSIPAGEERDQQLEKLEKTMIQSLINELLVLDRAKARKIEVSEDEIEQHINRLAQDNPQIVTAYDPDELKELVSKDFLKQRVIAQEVDTKLNITDEEMKTFCEEAMKKNIEVEIAHILFRGSEEEAQRQTEQVKKELSEGIDFAQLAKTYSEDPNAQKTGGKLGRFQKGDLLPAIDQVAFSLQKQEISELVKTDFGYHLIYLLDKGTKGSIDCNQLPANLRDQYYNQLFGQKRQKVLDVYLKDLRKVAQVVIY